MTTQGQLRVLTLNQDENNDKKVFRLEKGWTLHFALGPSLYGRDVHVYTDHPSSASQGPNRNNYRMLPWESYSQSKSDSSDTFAALPVVLAGSFSYYFTVNHKYEGGGRGYFLVDPVLKVGSYDTRIPLDAVACCTVLTKLLGPLNDWESRLTTLNRTGYNMVHFTPVQELGLSNSSYCIRDQLQLSSRAALGDPSGKGATYTWDDLDQLVQKFKNDWNMLSITDIVLNHTANESPWLHEHPECSFNMHTAAHLRPAFLLDRALWHLSEDVADGKYNGRGLPAEVKTDQHLGILREVVEKDVLAALKLEEFYQVNIDALVQNFNQVLRGNPSGNPSTEGGDISIEQDPLYRRLQSTVNMELARAKCSIPNSVSDSCGKLRARLAELNHSKAEEIRGHLRAAVDNFMANARWRFVDPNGPKVPRVYMKGKDPEPLMWNYFTLPAKHMTLAEEETAMVSPQGSFFMAHNGWVMGDDPLRNFAEKPSMVYLRRELIPWGDNVKLRFGQKRSDCPYLWDHMKKYAAESAKIFHGIRLDNCHSTPIHVAEYVLDAARKVRPDLYVIAELFTSSEETDNLFINRLGINSLIRESLQAWDPHELGRLVHRFGGSPVGSFFQPAVRPLTKCMAHAMFMDQTHDNESPVEKRTVFDLVPSSGLVAMACCATGSTLGYDQIIPHHVDVVKESRHYPYFSDNTADASHWIMSSGIMEAKREFNVLHQELAVKGYTEIFVDQLAEDLIAVTRHNPTSHESVILVARTCFGDPNQSARSFTIDAPGHFKEILFEFKLQRKASRREFVKDKKFLNGWTDCQLTKKLQPEVEESQYLEDPGHVPSAMFNQKLKFKNFLPGCVIAFKIAPSSTVKEDILRVREIMGQFGYRMHTLSSRYLKDLSSTTLERIVTRLSFIDFNRVLFRCGDEEKADNKDSGAYNIPGYGDLVYCGLQGIVSVLSKIRPSNDLGHPFCANLRSGDWLLHYTTDRLFPYDGTRPLGDWFKSSLAPVTRLPRFLIPCYADAILTGVYSLVTEVACAKMSKLISSGSPFARLLALGSIQFVSVVPNALLPDLSPRLLAPKPPLNNVPSISAGLPHFSAGIWRNWGRDTFIALRGLLLLTGRFDEARYIILSFAGTLRHGLIPNLLGSGIAARYNCRDSVWWWLQCIQDYVYMVPQGQKLLEDKVTRMYPQDDSEAQAAGKVEQHLYDVMQEALEAHALGKMYIERNAGDQIDQDMSRDGFTVNYGVDWHTGFVYGGNIYNCGTWMDKMGSSEKAGNKGKPATPRDGSAIELVALCKSTVRFLAEASEQKIYPYSGVKRDATGVVYSFAEWNRLIQENFEREFYVPLDHLKHERRPDLINRRGIYKDTYNSGVPWTDYQLRPNFPVAMVVAPEMFTAEFAWKCLEIAESMLLGPLGMKTLDPQDWAYRGNYFNSDDGKDITTAKGWNYHQGPEWLWPVGYFFRAKLHFARIRERGWSGTLADTVSDIRNRLAVHYTHLQESDWRSLPELTNENGSFCADSCHAQAWSVASILEVLYDLQHLDSPITPHKWTFGNADRRPSDINPTKRHSSNSSR